MTGALAGGFLGSLVLFAGLDAAAHARLTRLDVPLLLGSAVSRRRVPARGLGLAAHIATGLVFALVYAWAGVSGWGEGALAGLVHGVVSTAVIYPALPLAHPRLRGESFVEPPGILLRNYGAAAGPVLAALHVPYGALVGGFVALGG